MFDTKVRTKKYEQKYEHGLGQSILPGPTPRHRYCIFAVFFDWSWVHLDSHAGTGSMAEEGAEGTGRIEGSPT
jgi:hypothetical protein